jgi:hypothetical protein
MTYYVSGKYTLNIILYVEASSEEEAREKAYKGEGDIVGEPADLLNNAFVGEDAQVELICEDCGGSVSDGQCSCAPSDVEY